MTLQATLKKNIEARYWKQHSDWTPEAIRLAADAEVVRLMEEYL